MAPMTLALHIAQNIAASSSLRRLVSEVERLRIPVKPCFQIRRHSALLADTLISYPTGTA